jgi:16S rRNA (cytosine967-C5)-methyltransferase
VNARATKRPERRRRGGSDASGHGDGGGRARALAALAVDHVLSGGRTLDDAFAQVLNDDIPQRERSQVKALAFGALRWHHRHRLIIGELLERPLRSRDRVLEALLSVGIFELIDARQPDYAAVSTAVDAARRLKRPRATGLINATLRRFGRESGELLSAALADETGRFAHPRWLIERMREDWPDQWDTALTAALEQPPMWLRINRARGTPAEYAERLERECGIDARTQDEFPDALRIRRALPVADLPGFADGDVSVQDAAGQLAADLLAPAPDMRVLDACAAPGGKAVHLLERSDGRLRLVTVDIDGDRNRLLEDNLRRAGYQADVLTADACDVDEWAAGRRFDRILVDAPCSATGVIRRHPDIKFLRRAADIDALSERQLAMLDSLWPLLETGGRLLYATCSVLRAENDAVVTRFLATHPDATIVDPELDGGADALSYSVDMAGPGIQLLPGSAGTDGFYYALMERKG